MNLDLLYFIGTCSIQPIFRRNLIASRRTNIVRRGLGMVAARDVLSQLRSLLKGTSKFRSLEGHEDTETYFGTIGKIDISATLNELTPRTLRSWSTHVFGSPGVPIFTVPAMCQVDEALSRQNSYKRSVSSHNSRRSSDD